VAHGVAVGKRCSLDGISSPARGGRRLLSNHKARIEFHPMSFQLCHHLFLVRPSAVMLLLLRKVRFDLCQFGLAHTERRAISVAPPGARFLLCSLSPWLPIESIGTGVAMGHILPPVG